MKVQHLNQRINCIFRPIFMHGKASASVQLTLEQVLKLLTAKLVKTGLLSLKHIQLLQIQDFVKLLQNVCVWREKIYLAACSCALSAKLNSVKHLFLLFQVLISPVNGNSKFCTEHFVCIGIQRCSSSGYFKCFRLPFVYYIAENIFRQLKDQVSTLITGYFMLMK